MGPVVSELGAHG